ncbi:hemin-degrading factor [Pseudoalteromonas prydzensis]|uniref:hemin-degrading factor n=1 Tax=Pseudoalteromonas prydzensis TaxID=182141 RepID=UPI0007E4F7A6|nr:ChuX/HutX family heme-like substrate-binding protein [Pseudoalteromonas prydzensis]MBE0379882.1 putative hemin transport protein [Pseudoalteromonas prydzensis ACAM 620]
MSLLNEYRQLQAEQATIRAVDAAVKLQTTEAQLIAAQVGEGVTQLDVTQLEGILKGLKKLQHVMALTRNAQVVSEISGCYEKIYCHERNGVKTAISINPTGIDLRLFLSKWHSVFAVQTHPKYSSIQFFDKYGVAVHKVFTTEHSDIEAYQQLVNQYKAQEQSAELTVLAPEAILNEDKPINDIDIQGFRQGWQNLQDVHHFPALLTQFALSRTQGLEVAGEQWAQEVSPMCLTSVFETVKQQQSEIMIFVNNHAAVQIYTGRLDNLKQVGQWFNILDNGFNLHILVNQFSRAFVVKKPTDNGATEVHSIEFFDAQGSTIMTLFGRRSEGNEQSADWLALCNSLRCEEVVA